MSQTRDRWHRYTHEQPCCCRTTFQIFYLTTCFVYLISIRFRANRGYTDIALMFREISWPCTRMNILLQTSALCGLCGTTLLKRVRPSMAGGKALLCQGHLSSLPPRHSLTTHRINVVRERFKDWIPRPPHLPCTNKISSAG